MSFLTPKKFLSIDYGDKSIGLAMADSQVKIAIMLEAIVNDDQVIAKIIDVINQNDIDKVIIGYPRNQAGEPTKQTAVVEQFAEQLKQVFSKVIFKDESLTSVLAEERLKSHGRPYQKADIDSMAAVIILEDYLKENYG